MKIPENAIKLIKEFEGLKLKAYLCPAGVWTIGYGHTHGVHQGQTITEKEAEEMLLDDLYDAMDGTLIYCPILKKNPEKLGAIISFVFNLGAHRLAGSTLRKRINEEDWKLASLEIKKWVYAEVKGKKVKLPGLIKRREAESKYLYEGD